MKKTRIFGLGVVFAVSAAGSAMAHSTFVNSTAVEESTFVASLQIPHGCGGKATTEVQVKLPEGFISAKPQPKAGWELDVITGDYQKVYSNHGREVTSGAVEIRWKNGNLADAHYDTFVIQGKVSGVAPGSALAFPVTQLCGADDKVSWDEVAEAGVDPHSLKSPAPLLHIAAKDNGGHGGHGHGGHDAAQAAAVELGDIVLTGAFTKATLPGQPVGGGFVLIENKGTEDDRLVSVSSVLAGRGELHEMAMENDVMKMRKLEAGIDIPAGQTVELKPGGLHMMFFELKEPFAEGKAVPVVLTFEKAGEVEVSLPVTAAGPGGGHQHN